MKAKEKNIKNKKINKVISMILLFLIIFMQIANFPIKINAANDYQGLKLVVDPITSLNAGDTVTITISTDGAPIGALDAYIIYDLSNFEQVTEDDITFIASGWRADSILYDEEYYGKNTGYLIMSNSRAQTSTGDIARITLKLKTAVTTAKFAMSDIYVVLEDNSSVGPLETMEVEIDISKQYNITYDKNTTDTVTGMPSNEKKIENVDYTIVSAPERAGYTFKGWNTKADGSGTNYVPGDTYSTNIELTLYAQWEKYKIQPTLTVNPNGGVWEGSSQTQIFTQNEGTTKIINNPTSTPNGNRISFNANGGTASQLQIPQTTSFSGWTGATLSGTTYTFGTSNATIIANYVGNNITLPTATKKGTAFLGWYDSNGNYVGAAGDQYAPTYTTPNAVITLTARYEEEAYTLTINPNGGIYSENTTLQGTYNSAVTINNPTKTGYTVTLNRNYNVTPLTEEVIQTYTFDKWTVISGDGTINGTTYTFGTQDGEIKAEYISNSVTLEDEVRIGYIFDGWYTAATGGTKIESQYMPTSDITLYAHWTPSRRIIAFNPGEDGIVNPESKEVIFAQPYGELPIPTRPGYDFNGWYNSEGDKIEEDDIVTILSDTELTAKWLGTEYTIIFDPDEGKVDIASKTVRNEGVYGELPIPTKLGYTFEGWINSNGDKIESTTIVNLTDDETLTAKWEGEKYKITFDPGEDADIEETTKEITYGETYGTLPMPEKPGYTFIGWFDSNDNKIKENDIVNIVEDIKLAAKWEGNEYQLTFDYNGGTGDISNKTIKNGELYGELPEAAKEGHTFSGWYDNNGNKVESTNVVNTTSNLTIHAEYEINKYTITFKNEDGTIIETINVEYGSSATFTGELPTKTEVISGYESKFAGWDNEEDLQNVTKDVTVTATYELLPIKYNITYYNLKTAENLENPTTYTIEDENIQLKSLLDQGKYIFKGWYTSRKLDAEKIESIDTSKLENIVLYAQWENEDLYLSTEIYKIGDNDIKNYEEGDKYISRIKRETTKAEFINSLETNGTIRIIEEDGTELGEDELVGTGMTLEVTKGEEKINLKIVVEGDLSGDGKVTATDLSTLNQTILKMLTLENEYYIAADLDENEKITATDLSTINKMFLKLI